MLILCIRAIVLYVLVFMVIRLSGKRQISDLQPFDLMITLLVADLASVPASDTSIPLMYGVAPILTLYLVQQLFAYLSLKFERFRYAVCGHPLLIIIKGTVQERALRDARYTLNDLMEQLRAQSIFEISSVEYAILETNGQLSVLQKSEQQPATCHALGISMPSAELPYMLVQDGRLHREALRQTGHDEKWLAGKLAGVNVKRPEQLLFAFLNGSTLHLQAKQSAGGRTAVIELEEKKA